MFTLASPEAAYPASAAPNCRNHTEGSPPRSPIPSASRLALLLPRDSWMPSANSTPSGWGTRVFLRCVWGGQCPPQTLSIKVYLALRSRAGTRGMTEALSSHRRSVVLTLLPLVTHWLTRAPALLLCPRHPEARGILCPSSVPNPLRTPISLGESLRPSCALQGPVGSRLQSLAALTSRRPPWPPPLRSSCRPPHYSSPGTSRPRTFAHPLPSAWNGLDLPLARSFTFFRSLLVYQPLLRCLL